MIVSLNWIKKFVEVDIPVDELVTLINSRLVEVESVTNLGAKYEGILTAKAIDCNKLPDSDHLSIVKLDDNGANKDVERDSDGFVQVVCGAPNIATGQIVAWLPPEIVVPATFDSKEPLKLDARDLRVFEVME
jgi:phenylalanyl-tRNA synthetase beta chain